MVAKISGVSRATVSLVINNRNDGNVRISDGTRQRVWDAIQQLEYQPNANARSLRTQRTQLLAVMVPDITNPFYPALIRGVQEIASGSDYHVLVYDTNDRQEREQAFIDSVIQRAVDGVILVPFYLSMATFASGANNSRDFEWWLPRAIGLVLSGGLAAFSFFVLAHAHSAGHKCKSYNFWTCGLNKTTIRHRISFMLRTKCCRKS